MLVGMLKNASLWDPLKRAERVKNRRNTVLGQMFKNEFITQIEMDSLKQTDLGLDVNRETHSDGTATYFREYLRDYMKNWIKKIQNQMVLNIIYIETDLKFMLH